MSKSLPDYELKRLAWLTALRTQGDRQGRGWFGVAGQKVCAVGLLFEVLGTINFRAPTKDKGMDAARAIDMTIDDLSTVIHMNDGKAGYTTHSFEQIADWLEQKWRLDAKQQAFRDVCRGERGRRYDGLWYEPIPMYIIPQELLPHDMKFNKVSAW